MAPPYSTDLRWRIVWAVLALNMSPDDASKLFNVSPRTVTRYVNLFQHTGDVVPVQRRYGPYPLMGSYEQIVLLRMILEHPGIYLSEIQVKLFERFGVDVSAPTICRTLKAMGCSRQRIQYIALQRSEECRAKYMAEISIYDPAMFVWIDETGCDRRNSKRRYGYSVRGIPPRDHRLLVRGVRYSGITVMSLGGIHDVQLVEGSVNGDKFEEFVTETLLPILNPFDGTNTRSVVIMDNCSIHHVDPVKRLIETVAQAKLIFLPPYSPDLMPLKEVFNQVKSIFKANDGIFQVCTSPRAFLAMAFGMVTSEDCVGYIRHCGYTE